MAGLAFSKNVTEAPIGTISHSGSASSVGSLAGRLVMPGFPVGGWMGTHPLKTPRVPVDGGSRFGRSGLSCRVSVTSADLLPWGLADED